MKEDSIIFLELRGNWRDMGYQYGIALKDKIHRVLEWSQRLATEASDTFLLPRGLPMGIDFLDEFLDGMGEGAELTRQEVIRLTGVEVAYGSLLMEELGEYAKGQCAALALYGPKSQDGKMIYGRLYDWVPSFSELGLVVLTLHPSDSDISITSINYPGCIYFTTGMNSRGLFVEFNAGNFTSLERKAEVLHNTWWLWTVINRAGTVPDALEILQKIQASSNAIVGLADKDTAVSFEWGIEKSAVIQGDNGVLAMSNHFVQPGWTNLPSMYDGGCVSSYNRRKGLLDLAADVREESADVETMKRILDVPVEQGGAKWRGTLFQVIALPENVTMLLHFSAQPGWVTIAAGN